MFLLLLQSKKEGDNERKNYEKDKRYGTLLRQQVAENREKFDVEGDLNKKYAAIVEETVSRFHMFTSFRTI